MKHTKQILALLLAVVLCIGLLAGCAKTEAKPETDTSADTTTPETPETPDATETPAAEANADGTIVIAETGFEGKFSPFFAASAPDQDAYALTQIALLGADRRGEMVLNGIEGETREYNGNDYTYYGPADCVVTENEDGTVTYAITLRDDITFSDGTPMTIDDVIFNMYVYMDPTYDGSATFYSVPIVGIDEYRGGMDTRVNVILAAGPDGYTANDLYTEEQYNAFWAAFQTAGEKFAQSIADYVMESYGAEDFATAVAMWGYEATDAADLWNKIVETYGYDISDDGINKEVATTSISDFLAEELGDQNGDRMGNADGVGQLELALRRETRRDDVLCDIPRHICAAAVDLRRILAGERAAAVGCVAAVGVDDDLAAGQAGVASRATDDEAAGRVHVVFRVLVQKTGREIRLDDRLDDRLPQIVDGDLLRVLGRNDDRIDARGHTVVTVFNGHLALAVRAQPREPAGFTRGGQRAGQIVCVGDRRGHQLLRLRAGEAEHHALIAGAGRAVVIGIVDAHGDVRRLAVHGDHDVAAVAVKAHLQPVIASVADGLARELRNVDAGGRADLTHDEDETGRCSRLTGHAAHGILRQNSVQHAVRDQIAELVRMALRDGFRGENFLVMHHKFLSGYQKNALPEGQNASRSAPSSFDSFAGFGTLHPAGCRVSLGRSLHHS